MGKSKSKVKVSAEIRSAIDEAVKAGLQAGCKQAEQQRKDTYRATERRLYALPVLIKKVVEEKRQLKELLSMGAAPGKSRDIIRFTRPGVRLSPEEILDTLIADTKARIAADEKEIETIKKALKNIDNDSYYVVVKGRYFEQLSDDEIAKSIPCDPSTVRRQRSRLVRVLAVWLYGAEAV